jgi:hypothetical protein
MALDISGTDSTERITGGVTAPIVRLQDNKTITLWYYMRACGAVMGFVNLMNVTSSTGVQIGTRSCNDIGCWQYGGTYYVNMTTLPSLNQWHFISYTYNTSGRLHSFSIDAGTPVTASVASQSGNPEVCDFGGNAYGEPMNGMIDDIRIYNRVLSTNEIQTIYNLRGNDHIVSGLIFRWTFMEGASGTVISGAGTIRDVSGNAHHNTLVYGSPKWANKQTSFLRRTHVIRKG